MGQTAKQTRKVDYQSHRTRDHETIRRWAEQRGGRPAMVEGTNILRIDFGEPEEKLKPVSWEESSAFSTIAASSSSIRSIRTTDGSAASTSS